MSTEKDRKACLEAAYEKYSDMLYRLALSQLGNKEDAEDCVHDVFAKFIAHSRPFFDNEHEKAWFVRVTVNHCHDLQRKRKKREYIHLDEIKSITSEDKKDDGVIELLAKLPEKIRAVITLHYLEGYSVEETAKLAGISQSAVKMRLLRGREQLKEIIERGNNNA